MGILDRARLFTIKQHIRQLERAVENWPESEQTARRKEDLRALYAERDEVEELINK